MAQSIGNYAADIKRMKRATHAAHRKAFGPQRTTTSAQRAQYVAESIALRHDAGQTWTWATYGLEGNIAQQRLVELALEVIEGTKAEAEQAAWDATWNALEAAALVEGR
jgi:hypothetical protein